MKIIFLAVACVLSAGVVSAQKVIDMNEVLGKGKFTYTGMYELKDGNVLLNLGPELALINTEGKVIHRGANPIEAKKYKYDLDQYTGYNKANDIYFHVMDGIYAFVRNFSSDKRELVEIKVPKLENFKGSVFNYNDKKAAFNYYSSRPALSSFIQNIDGDNIVIARSYVSMSKNSHGAETPQKDKYNSFVRLTYINLKTQEFREEYVLKDVFQLKRAKDNEVSIKILGFENNEFKIGILELNKKMVHPAIRGYSFSGKYELQTYNIETKEVKVIGSTSISSEPEVVYSSLGLTDKGIALSWTEHIPDSKYYALKNKTYQIEKSGEVDSITYEFPVEYVSLLEPQSVGAFNYTNQKGDEFAVLAGRFVKSKRDKDPVMAYVLVNKEQTSEIRDRIDGCPGYYDDEKRRYYQLDLEIQDAELLNKLAKPLGEEGMNSYDFRVNCDIVKLGDNKFIAIKSLVEFKTGFYKVGTPASFLIQFIEFEL